ncbi:MAG TPA: DNA methyltransferase, partial [Candidatus Kapabacteria bacterium]|nr:DNA methyltransferase [Candidatus Kapabacteria bacterium]
GENDAKDCKVLDPACGSGIFLVEAYRRIVEREMARGKVSDDQLKEFLVTNIYGIDKDESALNVAIFSLYIALLDYKEPKDIKKIKLPELLNKKLFRADFFDTEHPFNEILKNTGLNFIIGNPPWKSDKSTLHLAYSGRYPVTDFQTAQTFMIRTKDFSSENTKSAFVVTSSVLHKAKSFRKYFLENFYIDSVLDLSSVRRFIFKEAINPAAIVFFRYAGQCDTKENIIKHLSVKSNFFLTQFDTLVIEKNDINLIKQKYFMESRWMWKAVLYGNILDFHMLKRLEEPKANLKRIIDDNHGLFYGNGILEGTPKEEPFRFLVGFPVIETKQITSYYTLIAKSTRRLKLGDTYLEAGRKPELYEGEHVLLRRRMEKETELTVSYAETSCAFRNSAYAIASRNCVNELKEVYGIFISKLFTYFQFMTSASWGIYLPEVNLDEYFSFPYTPIKDKKGFVALVDRFISYYKDYYSRMLRPGDIPFPPELEQINQVVNDAYGIDDIEKDLIDYVLDVSRYLFQESKAYKKALRRVEDTELKQYGQIFYDHFASIYNSPGEYFQVEYFYLDYFAAMKFKIVPDKPSGGKEILRSDEKNPERIIFNALAQKASLYKLTDSLYLNKVIKGFEEDFFYIIKPNEFKSWHRAIAHIDLAEFIDAINKAESEEMKEDNNG